MIENGQPCFTFKQLNHREPSSNSLENKRRRKEVIREVSNREIGGYRTVFIDEVHWEIGLIRNRGWSPKGQQGFDNCNSRRLEITAIASISDLGVGEKHILHGTVNMEIFEAYFKSLISSVRNSGKRAFFMDNAPVHNKERLQCLSEAEGHVCIFNAPHSPNLNPIETFFGAWKMKAEKDILNWTNLQDFINKISNHWKSMNIEMIISCINTVKAKYWTKVTNLEDI